MTRSKSTAPEATDETGEKAAAEASGKAKPRKRRKSLKRKLLTGCATFIAVLMLVLALGTWRLYTAFDLDEPEPKRFEHFVSEDIDAFVRVNISDNDDATKALLLELMKLSGADLPPSRLPALLTGDLEPDDTLLDLEGVLPARLAFYYRCVTPRSGNEVYGVASFPELPLKFTAAGAAGIRRWGDRLAEEDPGAKWECDGVPVVRHRTLKRRRKRVTIIQSISEAQVTDLHVALLNKTLFLSRKREAIRAGIRRFRGATPEAVTGRLKTVCEKLDPRSDIIGAARKQTDEIRRLLKMTEDTPPWELPPDRFMHEEFGIDPDAILAVSIEINFRTPEQSDCRAYILCPNAATADTFSEIIGYFIPRIGRPHMKCEVTGRRRSGSMLEVTFRATGILKLIRAKATGVHAQSQTKHQ